MLKKLHCIFFLFIPTLIFAQSSYLSDSAFHKIIEKDCDDKEFTKTEVLPSLKISREAYGDSIKLYLNSRNIIIGNRLAIFKFFLTKDCQILHIKGMIPSPPPNLEFVRDAILHFSDLWNPAVQNSHIVCSYITLQLEFRDDKINISIFQ